MDQTPNEQIAADFRAGFIEACRRPAPVAQDVDSGAFEIALRSHIADRRSRLTSTIDLAEAQGAQNEAVGSFLQTSIGNWEQVDDDHKDDPDVYQLFLRKDLPAVKLIPEAKS